MARVYLTTLPMRVLALELAIVSSHSLISEGKYMRHKNNYMKLNP